MRCFLAVLLVLAVASTASATEYLWFDVVSGSGYAYGGPGQTLFLSGVPGDTITIGAFMTDEGAALRGYSFELYTDGDIVASNLNPDASGLWTSSGGSVGEGTLLSSFALTAGTPPVLGVDTATAPMIMSFDITIGCGGWESIGGRFLTGGTHCDGTIWGGYYSEAYVGSHYMPAGHAYTGIGHYAGYDFGAVIRIPEPTSLGLLGLGAIALLRRR